MEKTLLKPCWNYKIFVNPAPSYMNPKLLLALLTGALFIISCSKEESFEKRKSDNNNVPLLTKVISQSTDVSYSAVTTFGYDSEKKLVNVKNGFEGDVSEPYIEQESRYYRSGKGLIERVVDIWDIFDEDGNFQSKDSIVLSLHSTSGGQYTYGIRTFLHSPNDWTRDSIIYSYNDKGRMVLVNIFRMDFNTNVYRGEQTTMYTHDGKGNIATMTIKFSANGQDPPQVISFRYNDKLSPMNFGDEALLTGFAMEGLNSPHCLSGVSDPSEPDASWEMSYDYNDFNKPARGVYSNTVTQEKINLTYFYQ